MLYHSPWVPSQVDGKLVSHKPISKDGDTTEHESSASSTMANQKDFVHWSDPALRLIDEETNWMDVDIQAPAGVGSGTDSITEVSLVIDTNILLGHLEVLQQFAQDVEGETLPIWIVIPGVVVEELDYQKTDRNRQLCWAARLASTWILTKLRERRTVRGQTYQETLQRSGSWKRRDPGTTNDDLIVDCCLFLREKRRHIVIGISQDNNLCATAESQGIPTLNPKTYSRWSSRSLARFLFGDDYPELSRYADYRETFRPKRVREALNDELGEQDVKVAPQGDDGMDIDDDGFIYIEPPPQHLLDDLHEQVLAHFGILLSELLQRVAPPSLFTESPARAGAASSMYASSISSRPAREWKPNGILSYLCNPRRIPRTASAADVKELTSETSRMIAFFTHRYDSQGRSGQHWARADWVACLEKLGVLARVYGDDGIKNSLTQLGPQMQLVFASRMRPSGTGTF